MLKELSKALEQLSFLLRKWRENLLHSARKPYAVFPSEEPEFELEKPKLENIVAPIPEPVKPEYLSLMCQAIEEFEGYYAPGDNPKYPNGTRAWANKNPGNLRRGAWSLAIGFDDKNFAIFKTKSDGLKTLENMITNAASGFSKVYFPNDNLIAFFQKYAPAADNNHPANYASYVARKIGVNPFVFQIREIL